MRHLNKRHLGLNIYNSKRRFLTIFTFDQIFYPLYRGFTAFHRECNTSLHHSDSVVCTRELIWRHFAPYATWLLISCQTQT